MCDFRSSLNSFVSFTPAKHRLSAEQVGEAYIKAGTRWLAEECRSFVYLRVFRVRAS